MLLRRLRRGVCRAWFERRFLVESDPAEWAVTVSAEGIEFTGLQVRMSPGRRAHHAVELTAVGTLAVHHHRRRENKTAHIGCRHRREDHRGAEVVVGDERRLIRDINTHADHRRVVADNVDAMKNVADEFGVGDVTDDELGTRIDVRVGGRPGSGMQRVEHANDVTRVEQGSGDMAADEPGASGDKNV